MNKYLIGTILLFFMIKAAAQNTAASVAEQSRSTGVADSLFAVGNYSKAISIYKKNGSSEEKIARAYAALGNDAKAAFYFRKAIAKESATDLTKYRYGKLLLKLGNYASADSLFTAFSENSKNPEFHYQLGVAKEKANDSTYFLNYNEALRLDNEHLNARYKLAKLMAEKRNFNGAIEYVEIGLAANPTSIRFLNLKAIIAFVNRSYHLASETYEKLLGLNQSTIKLHENLAHSYNQTNRFEKAITQYTVLINEYDDKNPSWHLNIAKNFEALRYLDKAQHHYEVAILLQDIPLDNSYIALSSVYKKQKDYKAQLKTLQKAVAENPKNQRALYFLATAADNYFEDNAVVIPYYEKYLAVFGASASFSEFSRVRIKDLKTDLHMNTKKQ